MKKVGDLPSKILKICLQIKLQFLNSCYQIENINNQLLRRNYEFIERINCKLEFFEY